MSSMYGIVPRRDRPVVANNVIALLGAPHHVCAEVQRSLRNVILAGGGCSSTDVLGKAYLDAAGRPDRVLDAADREGEPALRAAARLHRAAARRPPGHRRLRVPPLNRSA